MDESTKNKIQSIAKQYYKKTEYITQQINKISSAIEPYMKEITKNLRPLLDSINKEYNVDKKGYNTAIKELYHSVF